MKKGLKLKINAVIESFDVHTGKITKTSKVHNLVVDTGLDEAIDNGLSNIGYMAIGEGTTAVQSSDTALESEVKRESVTPTDEGTGIRQYFKEITFNSGDSYAITEAGLFNSAIASGSVMYNRFTFSAHNVDADNGVKIQITVTLTTA